MVKATLKEFGDNTTAHGFARISGAKNGCIRLLWIIIVCIAWSFLLWQLVLTFKQYFSYPTVTSVTYQRLESVPFPAVTICNENAVRFSRLSRVVSVNDSLYHELVYGSTGSEADQLKLRLRLAEKTHYQWDKAPVVGHQLSDILVSCQVNGTECGINSAQPLANVTAWVHGTFGNCYTFDTQVDSVMTGAAYGLELILYAQEDQYIPALSSSIGFRIAIHPTNEIPFPENRGFTVSSGSNAELPLTLRQVQKKPDPYSNCYEPTAEDPRKWGNLFAQMVPNDSMIQYSIDACYETCLAEALKTHCGCVDVLKVSQLPAVDHFNESVQPCQWDIYTKSSDCYQKVFETVYVQKNCTPNECPQGCLTSEYLIDERMSLYPSDRKVYVSWGSWVAKSGSPVLAELMNNPYLKAISDGYGVNLSDPEAVRTMYKPADPVGAEVSVLGSVGDLAGNLVGSIGNLLGGVLGALGGLLGRRKRQLGAIGAVAGGSSGSSQSEPPDPTQTAVGLATLKTLIGQFINKNFARINIYFHDLNVMYVEESPVMEPWTLASSLGGLMGLFVGISFITIAEFGYLFLELVYVVCCRKKA